MVSVLLHCDSEDNEELIAELHERGTTGILERGSVLEAFFDTAEEAGAILVDFARYDPKIRDHGNRDYVKEFQDHWQPALVGKRFWLAPAWLETDPPAGRLRLDYQAGMACGSGAHPCTRLCLEALEQCVKPGDSVLDVGAGSGILLMAARLLGAAAIAGCDIDHDTMVLARQALDEGVLYTGSTESVRNASFDVVIANISSVAAEQLFSDLERICRPGGSMILSGFPESDLPSIPDGGRLLSLDGWVCLIASRR